MKNKSSEVKLCVDCGATFKTDDTLKRHTLMQHSEGHEKHACQICGKDFWTRSDLRVHIKRHMNRGEVGDVDKLVFCFEERKHAKELLQ